MADAEHYLFAARHLRMLTPDISAPAFKTLLSRMAARGDLERVCRGIYIYPRVPYPRGLVLYHAASLLRAASLCYLSLESVLSEAGVISQAPMQRITLMTSGRRQLVDAGRWGTIEFIHTDQSPGDIASHLTFDATLRLWRADVALALRDLRRTGRSLDLIDPEVLDEPV